MSNTTENEALSYDSDMTWDADSRVDTACALADEIADIVNVQGAPWSEDEGEHKPVKALSNSPLQRIRIMVGQQSDKTEIVERLRETKNSLADLSQRQFHDMMDEATIGAKVDIEDMDRLLAEMRTVKRCVEAINAIEDAMQTSEVTTKA